MLQPVETASMIRCGHCHVSGGHVSCQMEMGLCPTGEGAQMVQPTCPDPSHVHDGQAQP